MKKFLISAGVLALTVLAFAAKKKDPVLMNVAGRPVYLSEFEYLYNKNNSQQLEPQTIDQYVDMFVNYKLKVADALAEGLDTTATFKQEYNQFRNELSQPYMIDSTVVKKLIDEAYTHHTTDLYVSHIMLPSAMSGDEMRKSTVLLDSLREAILSGKTTFEEAAAKYSVDRGSSQRGGSMGWVVPGRFPWDFERAAYNLKVGEISPVTDSGRGYHLIRADKRIPSDGAVKVQHVLKLTARKDSAGVAKAKIDIDSLYNLLANGADFTQIARQNSEDPGSAKDGGVIDFFGHGMMVNEFDSVSFALADGEISKPIRTAYGWHIVKRLDHRPVPSYEELLPTLKHEAAGHDQEAYAARLKQLIKKFNSHIDVKGLDRCQALIQDLGGYDTLAIAALNKSDIPVFYVNGVATPVKDIMHNMPVTAAKDAANARNLLLNTATQAMNNATLDAERDWLAENNADYRNLINEYRDGILLFDVSNSKVWERAAADKEGLDKYFAEHKGDYHWAKPKFKGFIVFATNDSVRQEAENYCNNIGADFNPDTFASDIRKALGRDVKVERVIAAEGDNAISDYLAFGGAKPDNDNLRWKEYFAFKGHIIDQPEEVLDVRGAVTTDYQNELERQWVEQLRQKYPFTIDQKVLKQIKK